MAIIFDLTPLADGGRDVFVARACAVLEGGVSDRSSSSSPTPIACSMPISDTVMRQTLRQAKHRATIHPKFPRKREIPLRWP